MKFKLKYIHVSTSETISNTHIVPSYIPNVIP